MKSTLKWYKWAKMYWDGEICAVGTWSGKCKVVVQAEDLFLCWRIRKYVE